MSTKILKVYGSYSLTFRRHDGEWSIKRFSAQSYSLDLVERIEKAINELPMGERTKEKVNVLAQELFDKEHYGRKS